MSESPAPITETPAERAERAATRRRWINLGEFVAVAGLIIAGISLWLTYADRKADLADKQADKNAEASAKAHYTVKASVRGGDIVIQPDDGHSLGDISVTFPSDLGISPQTSATQTIPDGWYKSALLKATDGGPDAQTGKLPVLLTVNYMADDKALSTTGIFDIVWKTDGRIPPLGRALHIIALRPHERGGDAARLDALWKAEKPAS